MSMSCITTMMVGIALYKPQLLVNKRQRGCSHEEPISKFCPQCGQPSWKETIQMAVNDGDDVGCFSVAYGNVNRTSQGYQWLGEDEEEVIIGVEVELYSTLEEITDAFLHAPEDLIYQELMKLGIDVPGDYGLHAVTHLSS